MKVKWNFISPKGYMEAIALNTIKVSRHDASYGAQRLFGSVGVVVATCLTGFMVDTYQIQGKGVTEEKCD